MRKRLILFAIALITLSSLSEQVPSNHPYRKPIHPGLHTRKGSMAIQSVSEKNTTAGTHAHINFS